MNKINLLFETYQTLISCDKQFFSTLSEKDKVFCEKIADYFADRKQPFNIDEEDVQRIKQQIVNYNTQKKTLATNKILEERVDTIYQKLHPEQSIKKGGGLQLPIDVLAHILSQGANLNTSRVSKQWHDILYDSHSSDPVLREEKLKRKDHIWRGIATRLGCPPLRAELGQLRGAVKQYCLTYKKEITKLPEARNNKDIQKLLGESITIENMQQLKEWRDARDAIVVWKTLAQAIGREGPDTSLCDSRMGMIKQAQQFSKWVELNKTALASLTGTLSLGHNQLASLPPEIGLLTALQELRIEVNDLRLLPREIGQLTALQELWIQGNDLRLLPREIGQLTALQELWIQGNELYLLPPEIGNLNQLKVLKLYANKLVEIPAEIGNLNQLKILNLANNKLVKIPSEIGKLVALEELQLEENYTFAILPPEIGNLTALKKLDVRHNQLVELPPEIVKLNALEILRVGHNQLIKIPPEIGKLTQLKDLILEPNPLLDSADLKIVILENDHAGYNNIVYDSEDDDTGYDDIAYDSEDDDAGYNK